MTMPAAAPLSATVSKILRGSCAGVDDLDRRDHVFGRAQHVGQADAGALERLAEHEGELDLDPRPAIILVRHPGAVGHHHVVEQVAVVRLVDLRGALHRLGGEADLVADQLGAGRDPALGHLGRDRIGVLDGDVGPGLGELHRLLALPRAAAMRMSAACWWMDLHDALNNDPEKACPRGKQGFSEDHAKRFNQAA